MPDHWVFYLPPCVRRCVFAVGFSWLGQRDLLVVLPLMQGTLQGALQTQPLPPLPRPVVPPGMGPGPGHETDASPALPRPPPAATTGMRLLQRLRVCGDVAAALADLHGAGMRRVCVSLLLCVVDSVSINFLSSLPPSVSFVFPSQGSCTATWPFATFCSTRLAVVGCVILASLHFTARRGVLRWSRLAFGRLKPCLPRTESRFSIRRAMCGRLVCWWPVWCDAVARCGWIIRG